MRKKSKAIITCAITGSIHTPSMSPYLPVTPDEIATQAVDAAKAGASILHLHARNPETGKPEASPDVYNAFLPRIKQACDAIINITTGGGQGMSIDDRIAAAEKFSPEMTSLNMGTMNFGLFPMLNRYSDFKHEWERQHLEFSKDFIFRNTFGDIEKILERLGKGHGVRFEFECYDVGHLYTLAHFLDRKLVTPPLFVQTIFGILGGIGPDPQNVMVMRETAERLFGDQYHWSVLAAGRFQLPFCTMAATMGANVRVGLEDNLYIGKGKLAESNAALVAKIKHILEELSIDVANAEEARAMLGTKGADKVGF
ncbi:3-keto-5-aminohexanoate cleavage protein [Aestuariivirga sp.]|uniref:3-keto-5-aminohexanoate cleavage protein n=1 Tax=Aestuariivirga sp. TaxID=2650926 RepID=UPI0039E68E12